VKIKKPLVSLIYYSRVSK